jgi:hypothetical protein
MELFRCSGAADSEVSRNRCVLYSFLGTLDRVAGVASITRARMDVENTEAISYELHWKPAKQLF